jgi:class 3 adenylate cyclase
VAEATLEALDDVPAVEPMGEQLVKGRQTPVTTYRIEVTVSTS